LIDKENYLHETNQLGTDGWFYSTKEQLSNEVFLSAPTILNAEKLLVKLDLISTCNVGLPARKHYKINYDVLDEVLFVEKPAVELIDPSHKESADLEPLKVCRINNKQINNKPLLNERKNVTKDLYDRDEILEKINFVIYVNEAFPDTRSIAYKLFPKHQTKNRNNFKSQIDSFYFLRDKFDRLTKNEVKFIETFHSTIYSFAETIET
jgi:hypothetical protein